MFLLLSPAALVALVGAQALALQAPVAPERAGSSAPLALQRAEEARAAGRLEEAARLYGQVLAKQPRSPEALWGLGGIAYALDRHAECRDSFRRLNGVQPGLAAAWALRGLCEFGLGEYATAHRHIEESLKRGLPPRDDIGRVVLYHQALLLVRATAFELAIAPLRAILQFQPPTNELNVACGLVLLRRPLLPEAVPAADRELVAAAGEAYCRSLARHPEEALPLFEQLLQRYPRESYLHYGYGLTLAQQGKAEAIDQYRREIEVNPEDVVARVELALALLARGRHEEAVEPARRASQLAPGLFAAHLALGRALVGTGDLAQGLRSLETAAALAPRVPAVHLALARAYAQAGRTADAERANRAFRELEVAQRGAASDAPGSSRP